MGVNLSYYRDFDSDQETERYRWIMVPISTATYTPLIEPEWGDSPAGGSTFKEIPSGVIIASQRVATSGYESYTVGMERQSSMALRFNLSGLLARANDTSPADTDLLDLHGFMKQTLGVTVPLSGVPSAPTIQLGHQWILKKGNKTDAIADFKVVFHGLHLPKNRGIFNIEPEIGAELEIKIIHIGEYLCKIARMEWLIEKGTLIDPVHTAEAVLNLWLDDVGTPTKVYGTMATPSANITKVWQASRPNFLEKNFRFRFATWDNFYFDLQSILNEIFQRLARITVSPSVFNLAFRSTRSPATGGLAPGKPIDVIAPNKRSYDADGSAGAEIDRLLSFFIHSVEDTNNGNQVVAGKMSAGNGSIAKDFEFIWDWLHEDTKNYSARARYKILDESNIEIWFLASEEHDLLHELARSDIVQISSNPDQESYVLSEAKMSRPRLEDLDSQANIVYGERIAELKWATEITAEVGMVNLEEEFQTVDMDFGLPKSNGLESATLGASFPQGIYDLTYYRENKSAIVPGATEEVFVTAHHDVRYYKDFDAGTFTDYTFVLPASYPTPSAPIFVFSPSLGSSGATTLQALQVLTMQNAGIARWTPEEILRRFGSSDGTKYEMEIKQSALDLQHVGDRFRFIPINAGIYSARPLLAITGDDSVDGLPGVGYINAMTPNDKAGTMICTLFGVTFV